MSRVTGEDLVSTARAFCRSAIFGHQGRRTDLLDCGGLILLTARSLKLSELEVLGYADHPKDGEFERLLAENADDTGEEFRFPFRFEGKEFQIGDLVSFDYGTGEGTRHIAFISKFERRRFWVIDATPKYGVSEHPLAVPLITETTILHRYRIRGLSDA